MAFARHVQSSKRVCHHRAPYTTLADDQLPQHRYADRGGSRRRHLIIVRLVFITLDVTRRTSCRRRRRRATGLRKAADGQNDNNGKKKIGLSTFMRDLYGAPPTPKCADERTYNIFLSTARIKIVTASPTIVKKTLRLVRVRCRQTHKIRFLPDLIDVATSSANRRMGPADGRTTSFLFVRFPARFG